MNILPKVSVFMITYNHENYITQALESILMQKCDFNFEIVVGEDCSTDKTREILLGYKIKYPKIFKLLLNEKNIGAVRNQINTLKGCRGEFIAICEGDDYWTDPYKLQKQVDFLEANTECGIIVTKGKIFDESKNSFLNVLPIKIKNEILWLRDALDEIQMPPTASYLFRNSTFNVHEFNSLIEKSIMGDLPLIFFILMNDKYIYYSNEITCVYRVGHNNNISQDYSKKRVLNNWIPCVINYIPKIKNKFTKSLVKKHISIQFERLAGEYFKEKQLVDCLKCLLNSFYFYPFKSFHDIKDLYWRVCKS
jgi:glycosyltransferase involved in cell wall biosynthesis